MALAKVSPDVSKYQDALTWFQKRTVITGAQARDVDDRLKHEAFWVGNGLQLDAIQRVHDKITKAIEQGQSLEDFKKAVKDELRNPAHTETVFRNATQRAYNAGRWSQMTQPDVLRFRPFGLVDAVLDGRTTPYCISVNGTLLPLEDEWWLTHWFPAHHRCRTSVRNLRRSEADKREKKQPPPGLNPPPGWGAVPSNTNGWKPDPAKVEPALIKAVEKKAPEGEKARAPHAPKEHTAAHWLPEYTERYGDAAPSLAHGRAALERGLDMTVDQARKALAKIDAPGVALMRDALQDADGERTLRAQAGELDPLRKAAAALAGHVEMIPARTAVTHSALTRNKIGKRALGLMSKLTGPGVNHPGEDWSLKLGRGRAHMLAELKRIKWTTRDGALEHEWAHALEEINPELLNRAKAFVVRRTAGDPLINRGGNGLCRDDQFVHHYVGRHYESRGRIFATEATSTSFELLVAGRTFWGSLEGLVQKDPEHFLFLLGQLAGP